MRSYTRLKISRMQVQGKVNMITLDQCRKTGLVFQDLVAACEIVNCTGVQVQATGTVKTLAIDKCDGVQVRAHLLREIMHFCCELAIYC